MEFCQRCGSRLIPMSNQSQLIFACPKCGFIGASEVTNNPKPRVTRLRSEESVLVESPTEGELRLFPTVKVECPKCHGNRAYYWTAEIGEEEETIQVYVFRCTACRHTWRERE